MTKTCDEPFDFFLGVSTLCGRPNGHTGPHHPIALACDDEPEELKP